MALTLEQYNLLQQAVACGYGLGGWEDIKRVCRLLWVTTCDNYDINIFNRTFDDYIQQHHNKMPVKPTNQETQQQKDTTTTSKPPANLPQLPPSYRKLHLLPQNLTILGITFISIPNIFPFSYKMLKWFGVY